jgi:hypothetical protein
VDLDGTALRGVADLTAALERERRLIEELRRAMLAQRDALAGRDGAAVEASIGAANRALLTLHETRRRRAALLLGLVGDSTKPLDELDAHFGHGLPESFVSARREVRLSAAAVAEEVWRNQEVLLSALRERDGLLQALLSGDPLIPPPPASEKAP